MKRLGLALKLIHRDEVHLLSTYCSRVHVILSLRHYIAKRASCCPLQLIVDPWFPSHSQQGLGFLLTIAR